MKRTSLCLGWLLALFISSVVHAVPPQLLLLTNYRSGMDVSGWYMSEKLDGVRAYWDGRQLLSRQGNRFSAPGWFTEKLPPFELDGELWVARRRFEEILSIVSRDNPHPKWQQITYNIFEVPNVPGGLDARLEKLRQYLERHSVTHLRIIPQTVCRNADHLKVRLTEIETAGGEGLVLRNPAMPYETDRSPNALKVKSFDDMEGKVVGYRPGKGKYRGMTGALWVEIEGGKRFYIGTGLTDRERTSPPPMGSIITFKHQGFTKNGIPRFASFMRLREKP